MLVKADLARRGSRSFELTKAAPLSCLHRPKTSVPQVGREEGIFLVLLLIFEQWGKEQHFWFHRGWNLGEAGCKNEDVLLKVFYFTIFARISFLLSSHQTSYLVLWIYKLLDKHTNAPHYTKSLLCVTTVTVI